ncbi:hypothetical protein BJ085DRAFT_29335 [Dimargaris cristalligena]|uniref:Uncharacterized protein n=1 Tax=Dimargaris cristalligena TaxID=215637 RepID=A0A4P9ZY13_9FUNG|nr:hypothetical protein BJ085DRAFT_29335 [Dimargaris cristalligena]|eukprot:RKP38625.1 hypothetical protein BJ085DRAFT_29335 [Dimargaris cristalligena]
MGSPSQPADSVEIRATSPQARPSAVDLAASEGLVLEGPPKYVTKSQYLRVNESLALKVLSYTKPDHASWLTDLTFQKILAFLKPRLFRKILAFAATDKPVALENYRCKDFQIAYGLTRVPDTGAFCMIQDPPIKTEVPIKGASSASCHYTGLCLIPAQLIIFSEPYDAHNPLSVPNILGLSQKESTSLDQYLQYA